MSDHSDRDKALIMVAIGSRGFTAEQDEVWALMVLCGWTAARARAALQDCADAGFIEPTAAPPPRGSA